MNLRMFFLILVIPFACICTFSSCSFDEESSYSYDESAIVEKRNETNDFFKNSEQSPLEFNEKESFKGLAYFAPNEEFAILASFEAFDDPDTVQLSTTKASEKRAMLKYGTFSFSGPDGTACTLTAFKYLQEETGTLFIPFKDKTNGFSTYETGRYLEVDETMNSEEFLLDFNRAYNPYCAYNANYSCPLIPSENILKIAILAGEQKPSVK